jgi:hypothetical protein
MVVVGSRVRNIASKVGHSLKKVGARHDADQLSSAQYRKAFDVIPFHRLDDFFERLDKNQDSDGQ